MMEDPQIRVLVSKFGIVDGIVRLRDGLVR
jgi:hypothetical protein